jgi:hypothetical protein
MDILAGRACAGAWLTMTFLLAGCFAVASYLAHRLFLGRIDSIILLWLSIGFAAVVLWNVLFLGGAIWEIYAHSHHFLYYEVATPTNPMFGIFSFAIMFVTNVLFAGAMKGVTNPYVERYRD